jgi:hypothetical protein
MKRLGIVFVFGLLSVWCFAQSQTGNASYNGSKGGLNIYHPSISIGRRVRIINLKNNSEVIATVNGRIAGDASRIADIAREAGEAIGMSRSGYTLVRIEQLSHEQPAAAVPAPAPAPPPPPPVAQAPAPAPPQEPREIIQTITVPVSVPQPQYIPAPVVERVQNCPLSPAIIVLLAIAVAILAAILVLLIHARRVPWWGYPWWIGRYPLWARRRLRYLKKRRR